MRLVLLSLLAVSALACASSTEDASTNVSANTEGRPLTVIPGRELGRCWFDVTSSDATMSCTSTARGSDPLASVVKVTVASNSGGPFVVLSKELDVEAGGTVVVGTMPRTAFPAILVFNAQFSRDTSIAVGNTKGTDLNLTSTINRPEDLLSNRPALMKEPFDIWPVAFVDEATDFSAGFFTVRAQYATSIAPYKGFLSETEMAIDKQLVGRDVKGKVTYYLSPNASSNVPLKVTTHNQPKDTSISQPGYYTVTAQGLRPSTTEEIARDFPAGPPASDPGTSSGDPTPNDPPPTSEPTPPPPTDRDPTCGGPNQPRCADGTCDNGTRWDAPHVSCLACGANNQTYCVDDPRNINGNHTCNDGTRWDATRVACVTCGANNQTYCVDDPRNTSGNHTCNDGTRWDATRAACITCGADNQTYCVDDPRNTSGNHTCRSGTRWDTTRAVCVSCGAEGQTYCFDDPRNTSGNRKCNDGLRYDSVGQRCVR